MVSINPTGIVKVASVVGQKASPMLDNAFPFTTRLILKPDLMYLAQSAILSRLTVGAARIFTNRPSNIKDPRLSPPQKKQAFYERLFMEAFGTPGYMLMMHLAPDFAGHFLQKFGYGNPTLVSQPSNIAGDSYDKANRVLQDLVGKKGVLGRFVFDEKTVSFTNYVTQLKNNGLGALAKNPEFLQTAEQWFRKAKVGATLTLVASMAANVLFGGVIIQKLNDEFIAPLLQRTLYPKPDKAGRD